MKGEMAFFLFIKRAVCILHHRALTAWFCFTQQQLFANFLPKKTGCDCAACSQPLYSSDFKTRRLFTAQSSQMTAYYGMAITGTMTVAEGPGDFVQRWDTLKSLFSNSPSVRNLLSLHKATIVLPALNSQVRAPSVQLCDCNNRLGMSVSKSALM